MTIASIDAARVLEVSCRDDVTRLFSFAMFQFAYAQGAQYTEMVGQTFGRVLFTVGVVFLEILEVISALERVQQTVRKRKQ